jgi:hypothetical protein
MGHSAYAVDDYNEFCAIHAKHSGAIYERK